MPDTCSGAALRQFATLAPMVEKEIYDVLVIGGGITGAGVLRDCALRGLKALLLEKSEPGKATTASSTHLIHGGLRYLLYDRPSTHSTSWDAGNITRIAGPLLTRLPIVWPVYRGHRHGMETVETLLETYDGFQRLKGGLPHLRLSAAAARDIVPGLREENLLGAVSFDEWWVDAVALVEKNLAAARALGAELRAHTRVTGLIRDAEGSVCGVSARTENGSPAEFHARLVVNAAGPWVDRIGRMAGIEIPLRNRKGTHLVYNRPLIPAGLLLETVDRARYVFVIPYPGGTLVGPTDLPLGGDIDDIGAAPEEIEYLLDSVTAYLPDFPRDYARTISGARPILGQRGSEKLLSREHEVFDHGKCSGIKGFLTVAGGKMSDFRLMAKDTVDLVCRKLGHLEGCRTHCISLDGEAIPVIPEFYRPWRPLKKFLRLLPRLREVYALFRLGAAFLPHLASRVTGRRPEASAAAFREHYGFVPHEDTATLHKK